MDGGWMMMGEKLNWRECGVGLPQQEAFIGQGVPAPCGHGYLRNDDSFRLSSSRLRASSSALAASAA